MSLDSPHRTPLPAPAAPPVPVSTAAELAAAVGPMDITELAEHHLELLVAVAELAHNAGRHWPWGPDDPTVALLRAVAKLALVAPDASSEHAAGLVARLARAD